MFGFLFVFCLIFVENSYTLAYTSSSIQRHHGHRRPLHLKHLDSDQPSMKEGVAEDNVISINLLSEPNHISRRDIFSRGIISFSSIIGYSTLLVSSSFPQKANGAVDDTSTFIFKPSKRATAYLVDSTKPPTLVPISKAREAAILKNIGNGLGTPKKPFVENEINLNNMMNKGVFGTIDFVRNLVGSNDEIENSKGRKKDDGASSSFVFLGVSNYYDLQSSLAENQSQDLNDDITLAAKVISDIIKPRRGLDTAIGLEFAPQSTQDALDYYLKANSNIPEKNQVAAVDEEEEKLIQSMLRAQIPIQIVESHLPIIRLAKMKKLNLLALAPELEDVQLVRKKGLQNLIPEKRSKYVLDTDGFINSTQDPSFRLYADKSLLKDFEPLDDKDQVGNYFAERILVHEAVATRLATYAASRFNPLVITIAPIKDVRFMGGSNKRITRVLNYIRPQTPIDDDSITTILLNPSAKETLSLSRFLRLEIGTAPSLIPYQTKVADYLWFSSMPKVNMVRFHHI